MKRLISVSLRKRKEWNVARPKRYKFTKKKRSRVAVASLLLSGAAIAGFFATLAISVKMKGAASATIGIVGIVLGILGIASLIASIAAVRNEDAFPLLPRISLVVSIIAVVLWVGVYILGFYFWN